MEEGKEKNAGKELRCWILVINIRNEEKEFKLYNLSIFLHLGCKRLQY